MEHLTSFLRVESERFVAILVSRTKLFGVGMIISTSFIAIYFGIKTNYIALELLTTVLATISLTFLFTFGWFALRKLLKESLEGTTTTLSERLLKGVAAQISRSVSKSLHLNLDEEFGLRIEITEILRERLAKRGVLPSANRNQTGFGYSFLERQLIGAAYLIYELFITFIAANRPWISVHDTLWNTKDKEENVHKGVRIDP